MTAMGNNSSAVGTFFTITRLFYCISDYFRSLICNAMYCNAEGYFKIMRFYYDGCIGSKPFAKNIMRYCKIHAKKIMGDDTVVKTGFIVGNKIDCVNFFLFLSIMI